MQNIQDGNETTRSTYVLKSPSLINARYGGDAEPFSQGFHFNFVALPRSTWYSSAHLRYTQIYPWTSGLPFRVMTVGKAHDHCHRARVACKVELKLKLSKYCSLISPPSRRPLLRKRNEPHPTTQGTRVLPRQWQIQNRHTRPSWRWLLRQ